MSVISAAQFRDQLDRWGVDYIEHSRWDRCLRRTVDWSDHEARRGRDCARRGWDAHGIAIHHSGGPTSWQFVWDGRSDVPGPLYTVLIYPDGKAHLTGFRITNNVGSCDDGVRNRVLRGDMPTSGGNVSPSADDYFAANSEFYGISYRGTEPNTAQRRTALLICAAICSAHGSGWDGGSVAGHKELTRRKPDPEGENMSTFRGDLNKLLANGPGGSVTPEEDDMVTWDDRRKIVKNVWSYDDDEDGIGPQSPPSYEGNQKTWRAERYLSELWEFGNDLTPRMARSLELLEAMADRELGADADKIKAHIDQRHAEAAQQRQTIAATMTERLDGIQAALDQHADGSLDAEAVVARIGELLST